MHQGQNGIILAEQRKNKCLKFASLRMLKWWIQTCPQSNPNIPMIWWLGKTSKETNYCITFCSINGVATVERQCCPLCWAVDISSQMWRCHFMQNSTKWLQSAFQKPCKLIHLLLSTHSSHFSPSQAHESNYPIQRSIQNSHHSVLGKWKTSCIY